MSKQTIIWTALPNGSDGPNAAGTTLRLSVFASPRLWNEDPSVTKMTLNDFPDFLDWPSIVNTPGVSFDIQFDGGAPLNVAATKPARSDLWKAIFKNDTTVVPFKFQNEFGVPISTFPAATIHDIIKDVFQTVATDPAYGGGTDLPPRDVLGTDPTFGEIAVPTDPPKYYKPVPTDDTPVFVGSTEPEPDSDLPAPEPPKPKPLPAPKGCGCGCLAAPLALLRRFLKWIGMLATLPFTMGMGGGFGGGTPMPAAGAASRKESFDQLYNYVQPTSKISADLPTPEDLTKTYDFHQMIATLGDYPNLLRYFGLVIDLEVTLPAAIGANGVITVTPKNLPLAMATTPYTPRTHYTIGNELFVAQPGPGSDLQNGLLRVDDTNRFRVLQLDVAGGGLKLQNTATTIVHHHKHNRWSGTDAKEQGLPSLQTAGISIARTDAADHLKDRFQASWALDVALRKIDASSPVEADAPAEKQDLFAEDLVRGYRVDVWDDKSATWHSLCRRVGTYTFSEAAGGPLTLPPEEDEGFVQMSVTEPVPGAGPRVLRAHDSLFTWNGWSLGAPRYGNTILKSDSHDPDDPTQVGAPSNAPDTQFKMTAAFTPKPKSLPRLRFGYSYQLRVRATDLAGNSVFSPDDAAFGVMQTEVTDKVKYRRFEPISPPMVMLQAKPVEGESLERLVVRSKFNDSDAVLAAQQTARHIVPPKTSQLMAEHHRKFDGSPAMNVPDYPLAEREAGSLTERVKPDGSREPIPGASEIVEPGHSYWIQANDSFIVSYLPDPYARGVLLLGLPGMTTPDEIIEPPGPPIVNKIPFEPWPDPKPFRLRMTGIAANAPKTTPVWDGINHVLDVQIPQGETYEVRISSYFHPTDLENMAVWAWTAEKPVPNLNDLRTSAIEGRNWLHLPFRTLVLVHAVQQPLKIPKIDSVTPQKKFGETLATLDGKFLVDAKSTGKVDVQATWKDPFDDVTKPAFIEATDFVAQKMQLAEVRLLDPADDLPEFTLSHPVGDTKYHAVTYTPAASTRFREYFPESVTADPKNLVRPTGAEAGIPTPADILNSARPDKPKPLYMVPLFQWMRSGALPNAKSSRRCGGLRVYMERPWFSSGAGELLGVTLKPAFVPFGSDAAELLKKFTSEWGMDPLWPADATFPLMTPNFLAPAVPPMTVKLAENGRDVDIVGYAPQFDADRNLWYCDILLDPGTAYFPMVHLVFARFQPKSVAPAHISTTVPADFIQLVPHRDVTYDTTNLDTTGIVAVKVNGPAYEFSQRGQFSTSLMILRLEQRTGDGSTDEIGWERVASAIMTPTTLKPENTVWQGQVRTAPPRPNPLRIVVLEVEVYGRDTDRAQIVDALQLLDDLPESFGEGSTALGIGYRITFADTLEVP